MVNEKMIAAAIRVTVRYAGISLASAKAYEARMLTERAGACLDLDVLHRLHAVLRPTHAFRDNGS